MLKLFDVNAAGGGGDSCPYHPSEQSFNHFTRRTESAEYEKAQRLLFERIRYSVDSSPECRDPKDLDEFNKEYLDRFSTRTSRNVAVCIDGMSAVGKSSVGALLKDRNIALVKPATDLGFVSKNSHPSSCMGYTFTFLKTIVEKLNDCGEDGAIAFDRLPINTLMWNKIWLMMGALERLKIDSLQRLDDAVFERRRRFSLDSSVALSSSSSSSSSESFYTESESQPTESEYESSFVDDDDDGEADDHANDDANEIKNENKYESNHAYTRQTRSAAVKRRDDDVSGRHDYMDVAYADNDTLNDSNYNNCTCCHESTLYRLFKYSYYLDDEVMESLCDLSFNIILVDSDINRANLRLRARGEGQDVNRSTWSYYMRVQHYAYSMLHARWPHLFYLIDLQTFNGDQTAMQKYIVELIDRVRKVRRGGGDAGGGARKGVNFEFAPVDLYRSYDHTKDSHGTYSLCGNGKRERFRPLVDFKFTDYVKTFTVPCTRSNIARSVEYRNKPVRVNFYTLDTNAVRFEICKSNKRLARRPLNTRYLRRGKFIASATVFDPKSLWRQLVDISDGVPLGNSMVVFKTNKMRYQFLKMLMDCKCA